jgi:hypothetical protein
LDTAAATAVFAILSSALAIGAGLTAAPRANQLIAGTPSASTAQYALLAALLVGLAAGLTLGLYVRYQGWIVP